MCTCQTIAIVARINAERGTVVRSRHTTMCLTGRMRDWARRPCTPVKWSIETERRRNNCKVPALSEQLALFIFDAKTHCVNTFNLHSTHARALRARTRSAGRPNGRMVASDDKCTTISFAHTQVWGVYYTALYMRRIFVYIYIICVCQVARRTRSFFLD